MSTPDPPTVPAPVTVVLVDDHRLVRAGLRSVLEADGVTVVGEAGDGSEAVAVVLDTRPDVVLMDLSMPGVDGVEGTRRLRAADATTGSVAPVPVVVLTSFADGERVRQALEAGATGYLLKDSEPADVLSAVRAAARGHVPIDPRVARSLLPVAHRPDASHPDASHLGASHQVASDGAAQQDPTHPAAGAPAFGSGGRPAGLSEREREVLVHVARGLANKQVARVLGISERTVKVHLGNVFRRIGVADRTSAALWARDHGLR